MDHALLLAARHLGQQQREQPRQLDQGPTSTPRGRAAPGDLTEEGVHRGLVEADEGGEVGGELGEVGCGTEHGLVADV